MVVETNNDKLCINQIIGHKTDTLIIEEDFVVPDIKPDILNSINTSGNVCIYKKEVMDGKLKVDGCINAYIIYLADNEENQIRSMNTNLNFSQIIDLDKLKIGMMTNTSITIKQIECRVLNGRKINVRAILEADIKVYSNENFEFLSSINNVGDIQLLKNDMQIDSLLGYGNTRVYAKDTIVIDDADDLAEIMKVNIEIKNKETKISYNKILIKADCSIKIMYLTTDSRVCSKSYIIPVMGFIDMPDVSDNCICDMQYEVKNMIIKPNSIEEHSIYTEIEIEAYCSCYTIKNLELIQDLYSPSTNLIFKQDIIKTMSDKNIIKDICPIREKQVVEDIRGKQIYDVDVKTSILSQNVSNNKIMYEGELKLNFIYGLNDDRKIDNKEIIIPFNYNIECTGISSNSTINTNVEISSQDFIILPDESIDIKIDLQFIIDSFKNENINLINKIDIEENRDMPSYSIIIYFVKPNDTLWKIAKRFRSTVNAIATLNQIENENNIEVGEQLFIPMFHG